MSVEPPRKAVVEAGAVMCTWSYGPGVLYVMRFDRDRACQPGAENRNGWHPSDRHRLPFWEQMTYFVTGWT